MCNITNHKKYRKQPELSYYFMDNSRNVEFFFSSFSFLNITEMLVILDLCPTIVQSAFFYILEHAHKKGKRGHSS